MIFGPKASPDVRNVGFLDLAGTVPVPAAKRNVAWDQVIRRTKSARAAARR